MWRRLGCCSLFASPLVRHAWPLFRRCLCWLFVVGGRGCVSRRREFLLALFARADELDTLIPNGNRRRLVRKDLWKRHPACHLCQVRTKRVDLAQNFVWVEVWAKNWRPDRFCAAPLVCHTPKNVIPSSLLERKRETAASANVFGFLLFHQSEPQWMREKERKRE